MNLKNQMTSFDIAAEAKELSVMLTGGFVDKVYQPQKDEILLRINVPSQGKKDILIKLGRYIVSTKRTIEMPETPSNFAMLLRKNLDNARVVNISQYKFDRILEFELQKNEKFRLIVELFSDGNVILVKNGKILAPLITQSWKDREVRSGEDYLYPPSRIDPRGMSFEDFSNNLRSSKADLVRTLAVSINLGGLYAEETCLVANLDKSKKASSLIDKEIEILFQTVKNIIERLTKEQNPAIVIDNDRFVDVVPIKMQIYDNFEKKEYPSFNDALDDYFANIAKVEYTKENVQNEKIEKIKRQIAQQTKSIDEFYAEQERARNLGDKIYANYGIIENALNTLLEAKERLGWQEIMKQFSKAKKDRETKKDNEKFRIEEINPSEGYFVIRIFDGEESLIKIDIRKSINENAQDYYEKAKKWREKADGAKNAIQDAQLKLKEAEEEAEEERIRKMLESERIKRVSKKFWYESYRWFISSDGNLVLAGKDAESNDKVVKKHLGDDDRYVHADIHGAPSVVVKKKQILDISELTLKEACIFAVCFSRAWSANIGSERAYWVTPSQVSKTPQAGEFLARGAFIIRGKRNYCEDIPLRLAIGEIYVDKSTGQNIVENNEQAVKKIMCAPISALEKNSKRYAIIEPGEIQKNEFANKLAKIFEVPMDEVLAVLPPGGVRIVSTTNLEIG